LRATGDLQTAIRERVFALLQECDAADVRMGMRVEAVWAPKEEWGPTAENIRYFRPVDEPDVPYDEFKEHL